MSPRLLYKMMNNVLLTFVNTIIQFYHANIENQKLYNINGSRALELISCKFFLLIHTLMKTYSSYFEKDPVSVGWDTLLGGRVIVVGAWVVLKCWRKLNDAFLKVSKSFTYWS